LDVAPRLALTLLGEISITLNGQPVTHLESDKVRALLARLTLEPERAFRRETLSALFWPESSPSRAAQNLRQSLYALRQAIGESFLLVTPQTVQFNTAADVDVDVLTWRRLLAEVQSHRHRRQETCRPCLERLAQAVDLYRGDLLAGFALKDCPEFDDWLTIERERLHVQALASLALLANDAERRGDYPVARAYIRRQLTLEPWQEEAHRRLMRLLALEGRRAAALEQFEVCRRTLADELGLAPTEETRTLYAQIRAGAPLPAPAAIPPDLPTQLTSFVGREAELALLVTSRQRLNLQAESVLPLEGLPCAETAEGTSDAVQLFAERAGRARLDFAVAPTQQAAVTEICRLVEGSPLGIELAAAWAGELSPARIADEISLPRARANGAPAYARAAEAGPGHECRP